VQCLLPGREDFRLASRCGNARERTVDEQKLAALG